MIVKVKIPLLQLLSMSVDRLCDFTVFSLWADRIVHKGATQWANPNKPYPLNTSINVSPLSLIVRKGLNQALH